MEWWLWPLALFAVTFAIGIVAVLAGVGGGVLFVPIVGALFPFHLDFVRAAGLLLALTGALSAAPALLRSGLASLRLAMPLALAGSITSIIGALIGLALPTGAVQLALGATILAIALLMWRGRQADSTELPSPDPAGTAHHVSAAVGLPTDDGLTGEIAAFLESQRSGGRAAPPPELPTMGYIHDAVLSDPVVSAYCRRFGVQPERSRLTGVHSPA